MANTYKDIIITPSTDTGNDPNIEFRGANGSVNTSITLNVYPTSNGMISFEGSDGQLFSITNDLSDATWTASDMSGIPIGKAYSNGDMTLLPFGGNLFLWGTTITGVANAIEWLNNTASHLTLTHELWGSATEKQLTDAATIAVDFNSGINFNVTLGASRALGNPTNAKPGQTGYIAIYSGGAYTLSYGTNWKFANNSTPANSGNTSAKDILAYSVMNDGNVFGVMAVNVPD